MTSDGRPPPDSGGKPPTGGEWVRNDAEGLVLGPGERRTGSRPRGAHSVLLVEPDGSFARLLRAFLQECGMSVECVQSGRQALSFLKRTRPSIVVTSLEGSDIDGLEFLEIIRFWPDRPVVILCTTDTYAGKWSPEILRQMGVNEVIVRPTHLTSIFATIESVIRRLPPELVRSQ